ncbi:MAG: hypothetical protein ABIL51_03305, partial [candidate division WOR-3 bacterium]
MKRFLYVLIFGVIFFGCKKKNPYEDNPHYVPPSSVRTIGNEGGHHHLADVAVSTDNYIMLSSDVLTENDDEYGIVSKWDSEGNLVFKKEEQNIRFGGIGRISNNKFMIHTTEGMYLVDLNGNISPLGFDIPIFPDYTAFDAMVFREDTVVYVYDSTLAYLCLGAKNANNWSKFWSRCVRIDTLADSLNSYYRFIKTVVYHKGGYIGIATLKNEFFIVVKINGDGSLNWAKEVKVKSVIWDGIEAFDRGIVLVGDAGCPIVIKLDSLGNLQWFKKFCNAPNGRNWVFGFNTVSPTSDGKYFAFGYSSTCS